MNKIVFFSLMLFALAAAEVCAQGFITPVEDIPHSRECYVIRTDGIRVDGMVRSITSGRGIKTINLVDTEGNKLKIAAEEVEEFGVKATGLVKMELMAESTETIKKFTKADFEEIQNREYIIFEQVQMPGQKGKRALVQLLNPGFDSKLRVYQDPWANETQGLGFQGISITGEEDKSYIFARQDQRAFIVKKGSYKKDFSDIFIDCPELLRAYAGEKTRFKDAAQHVWLYDRACSVE